MGGDVSRWDVSKVTTKVTNMRSIFYRASSFNGDVSKWDTSNVRDWGMATKKKLAEEERC